MSLAKCKAVPHEVVGKVVRHALERGVGLDALPLEARKRLVIGAARRGLTRSEPSVNERTNVQPGQRKGELGMRKAKGLSRRKRLQLGLLSATATP